MDASRTASSPKPDRFERRRTRTRRALIGAARQILAEQGGAAVSIQQIAEQADVGFGTFYNHFETKDALFDAAVADALEEYGQLLDAATGDVADPAERFAANIRLTLVLAATHPEITGILRLRGMQHIHASDGLGPRALRDLEHGRAAGRFRIDDPVLVLSAIGGAVLGLLELHTVKRLDEGDGTRMAELLLRMLGLPDEDAHEVATRPLPALDQ
ncbi:TetR/AcrR family transcriptional regulator [Kitasatospora sp. NPDC058965]|uniref:TetR/AcrR family transcriptional regulator n=1 Tax=Kitasatospora sp. NPDC058965 TaxID=3346682 RepID=UPI0036971FD1